ncbi:ubiquinol-cytochrome c reductase iron-sulfur subunit [Flagellimonas pacifica]|uniref:Ferredoxin subunit of nitrite reductase or a ring-hydroxylating dioxygenase n=1 Tax=Flagellimonas pacifica TaxID=1247520 RepID=A0A285MSK3_9FLAO|nr:Rieske (2Fe-2S) protein [Allomuricauda parva]SNZ00182.1 Ferredoxin subunit of nitrite reductase or a ring-hydroxylating dioxygenase [Allomuricauda parva]
MERKDFLRSLGAGAAFALTFPCVNGCSKDAEDGGDREIPSGVDFTVDLASSKAAALANNGGFIEVASNVSMNGLTDIVVARNLAGNLVAASLICSHQGYAEVEFVERDGGIFECNVHGSRFGQDGTPLNQVDSNPAKALKVFSTELNGETLRVFE